MVESCPKRSSLEWSGVQDAQPEKREHRLLSQPAWAQFPCYTPSVRQGPFLSVPHSPLLEDGIHLPTSLGTPSGLDELAEQVHRVSPPPPQS